jgi:hypothetical protein
MTNNNFFLSLSLVLIFSLCACNSMHGSFVEKKSVNSSVHGLMKAFDRATTGLRGKSANGREIVSRYQIPGSSSFENAGSKNVRAYSRLLILGDRRPYTIQIQHVIEERGETGSYEVKGYDDAVASQTLKKVIEYLVTRPDKEDFIDDHKVF